jgi:hypothetical protein
MFNFNLQYPLISILQVVHDTIILQYNQAPVQSHVERILFNKDRPFFHFFVSLAKKYSSEVSYIL